MIKSHDHKRIQVYDIETYPNLFAIGFKDVDTGVRKKFRVWADPDNAMHIINEFPKLIDHLLYKTKRLIGYNNKAFDDILVNYCIFEKDRLMKGDPLKICQELKQLANTAILAQQKDDYGEEAATCKRYLKKNYIPSTDLILLFNPIDRVSLKQMAVNLKWHNIIDLPYPEYSYLNREQMEEVTDYLDNDVDITELVLHNQAPEIELRYDMKKRTGIDFTNSCRTDIAKKMLINYISKETNIPERKLKRMRTEYTEIALKDCIVPKIRLITKEGDRLRWAIENKVINPNLKETGKKKKQFEFTYKSKYVSHTIGLGGIHSNNPPEIMIADENYIYLDIDATSFYPYLMVNEQFYPAHIGPIFVPIYHENVLKPRVEAKAKIKFDSRFKIDAETLKIVANGTFGLTKAEGFLKDAMVTIKTCLNGELMLIMLIEWIETYTQALAVYSNTDGLTLRIPISEYGKVLNICQRWEYYTGHTLEYNEYVKIVILNVNNYLIVMKNGDIKVKGSVFNNKIQIAKGYSFPIIAKALFDYYVSDIPVETTIKECNDIYMFMVSQRVDIDKFDVVFKNKSLVSQKLQKTNRWIITKNNPNEGKLYKVKKEDNSIEELQSGWLVTVVNKVDDNIPFQSYCIDYSFYIGNALAVINQLKHRKVDTHIADVAEQLSLFQ